jgi:hypothetical protein
MTYYRLAIQDRQTARWIWKTTALTSLQAVFQLLRIHSMLPQGGIRVFTASSKEDLNEMLRRQNNNLASSSVTATQFLQERKIVVRERAQSASEQSFSAQAAQQGTRNIAVRESAQSALEQRATAQAAQQEATVATSPFLREYITTTGAPESNCLSLLDKKRLELELGPGSDHDESYNFALPASMPQVLAWMRLLARVQRG